jgi:Ca2+:H+ antiporter
MQPKQLLNVKLMLIFGPVAFFGHQLFHLGDVPTFIFAALAIIPLAELIGEATEELAAYVGETWGGLLNATLGNAAELIITIFALSAGKVELVRASIVGSIIGNILLVMGLSLLLGGLKNGVQRFQRPAASLNSTMIILAFMALAIPSFFDRAVLGKDPLLTHAAPAGANAQDRELLFSEGIALILILLYSLSVLYNFKNTAILSHAPAEIHHAHWSVRTSLMVLAAATFGIVFMSETLVGAVEGVTEKLSLSEFFIGIIVVPLIGNVAEHLVAVQVAIKNRMDLSLTISFGSSLQIALFVAPVLVFISLLFGDERKLLLVFNPYELISLAVSAFIAASVASDGESNWLEGAQLLALYLIIGLAFFVLPS